MRIPMYREDAKGHIAETIRDCVAGMASNIKRADHFIVMAQDCDCYEEFSKVLTDAELDRAFKTALHRS